MNSNWIGYGLIIAACIIVESLGSILTIPSIADGWYGGLAKPRWTPPDYVFGPVWTILFLMMALAACRVWSMRAQYTIRTALLAFALQLALNLGWSLLFFACKSPLAGFIDILCLLTALVCTIILFRRLDRSSGLLLVPYNIWIIFAALLNLKILQLNS